MSEKNKDNIEVDLVYDGDIPGQEKNRAKCLKKGVKCYLDRKPLAKSSESGAVVPQGITIDRPIDSFNLFFQQEFIQDCFLNESNIRAHILESKKSKPSSKFSPITLEEISKFLASIMFMVIKKLPA